MPKTTKQAQTESGITCLGCGITGDANFYVSRTPYNKYKRIPYCKKCIKSVLYPYYLQRTGNANTAFCYLLRSLDVPYIHEIYVSACKSMSNPNSVHNNINNTDDTAVIAEYFKTYNSFHDTNKFGDTFADSVDIDKIENIELGENIAKIRHNKNLNKRDTSNYEILEYDTDYLIHKYGNFPVEDLIYLEEEYLLWKDKLGKYIDDPSVQTNVRMLCLEFLKYRKNNEQGAPAKDELTNIQNIMKTSGLNEKVAKNEENIDSIGMKIEDIEERRPVKPAETVLDDVDGYKNILLGFAGATSRALGKENEFTKDFDDIMGKYSLDVFAKQAAEEQKEDSDGTKTSD